MTFKEWLEATGMSMRALGKLSGFSTGTIRNLVLGKPAVFRTVKRLVRVTKKFPHPLTYDMFPKIFLHGRNEIISGAMAFKNALGKILDHSK